jgi:hypothetical protein
VAACLPIVACIGIAYNLAVAIFGGTEPFIIALIELTGDDLSIAYYLMAAAAAVYGRSDFETPRRTF